jgi:hypothetical protein
MRRPVQIENIEEMRLQEGIDDAALREEIRGLGVGDFVKLTLLGSRGPPGETLLVRITRVRGSEFRGVLARPTASASRSKLHVGSSVSFTTAHIHSLPRRQKAHAAAAPAAVSLCSPAVAARAPRPAPESSLLGPKVEGTPMTAKVNASARPSNSTPQAGARPQPAHPPTLALTAQERLQGIATLGQRINVYVQFMCAVGNLSGTSAEAKEKAIAAFYEQMVALEGALCRIQEDLRLG